jgi:hypothetical protein
VHAAAPVVVFSQRQLGIAARAIKSVMPEHCAAASPTEVPSHTTIAGPLAKISQKLK